MDSNTFPTKSNLMKTKSTLELSNTGYDLLDQKRQILTQEMTNLMEQAKAIQGDIDQTFKDAYKALQEANISIGINTVDEISQSVDVETQIEIKMRSVMGVEIPMVHLEDKGIQGQYGFSRTPVTLDEAYYQFNRVKKLTLQLAEIENAIYRLAINIRRTQKRANALQNELIPKYEKQKRNIQNALEEKEREDFTRMKMIKGGSSHV